MTERKRISLTKPPQPEPTTADAEPAPYRPPVRGAGSAPRKRPSAADAARAAEERAKAPPPASGPAERPPRSDRQERQEWQERPNREQRPSNRSVAGAPRPDSRSDSRRDPRADAHSGPRSDPRSDPARRPPQGGPVRAPQGLVPKPPRAARPVTPARTTTPPTPATEHDGRIRLSKLMSERGLSSRREADEWIAHGWVSVDGQVVSELGSRVRPDQVVTIDMAARSQQAQRVTILINKPIGYVSGQAEDGYEPAVVLIRPENQWTQGDRTRLQLTRGHLRGLAPAGRLDIDSTGLLVLTQDGRIARELIGEHSPIEKEYLVRVELVGRPDEANVSAAFPQEELERLRHGLWLDERELQPAKVSWQNEQQLRFVLREGRKRQIRRMCEQVGLKVVGLKRVRVGRIALGHLPLGHWRFLNPDERF